MYLIKTKEGVRASNNTYVDGLLAEDQIQAFDLIKNDPPYKQIEVKGYAFTVVNDMAIIVKEKTLKEKMGEAIKAMADDIKEMQDHRKWEEHNKELKSYWFGFNRPLSFIKFDIPDQYGNVLKKGCFDIKSSGYAISLNKVMQEQELKTHALDFLNYYINLDDAINHKVAYQDFIKKSNKETKDAVKRSHVDFLTYWAINCNGKKYDDAYNEWRKSLK